jgi:hypothetical protein
MEELGTERRIILKLSLKNRVYYVEWIYMAQDRDW